MSGWYYYFQGTVAVVTTALCFVILVVHSLRTYRFQKYGDAKATAKTAAENSDTYSIPSERPPIPVILSHAATIATIFCFTVFDVNLSLDLWSAYPLSLDCTAVKKLSVMTFHLSKALLYCVLGLRLKLAFGDSFVARIPYVIWGERVMWILLVIFITTMLLIDALRFRGHRQFITDNHYYCVSDFPFWGTVYMNTFDLIISVLCLILFYKPLRDLNKKMLESVIEFSQAPGSKADIDDTSIAKRKQLTAEHNRNDAIQIMLSKYVILATTAIMSTLILVLIYGATSNALLTMIDSAVNSVCLVMMSNWYDSYYFKLCVPCITCSHRCSDDAKRQLSVSKRPQKMESVLGSSIAQSSGVTSTVQLTVGSASENEKSSSGGGEIEIGSTSDIQSTA